MERPSKLTKELQQLIGDNITLGLPMNLQQYPLELPTRHSMTG